MFPAESCAAASRCKHSCRRTYLHAILVLTQEPRLGGAETDFYPYTRLLSLFSRGWLLWMRTAASRREREVDTF